MPDSNSEHGFHERLAARTESAADELQRRFGEKLCSLVEREMGRRFRRRWDPEDVVQSALCSFFRGIDDGRFQIGHSGSLWPLLTKITINKLLSQIEKENAHKRNPAREEYSYEGVLYGREPMPSEAVMVADLIEAIITGLAPPYPEILRLRLQGHTEIQIAQQVGCGRQAVHFKLGRIRQRVMELLAESFAK